MTCWMEKHILSPRIIVSQFVLQTMLVATNLPRGGENWAEIVLSILLLCWATTRWIYFAGLIYPAVCFKIYLICNISWAHQLDSAKWDLDPFLKKLNQFSRSFRKNRHYMICLMIFQTQVQNGTFIFNLWKDVFSFAKPDTKSRLIQFIIQMKSIISYNIIWYPETADSIVQIKLSTKWVTVGNGLHAFSFILIPAVKCYISNSRSPITLFHVPNKHALIIPLIQMQAYQTLFVSFYLSPITK